MNVSVEENLKEKIERLEKEIEGAQKGNPEMKKFAELKAACKSGYKLLSIDNFKYYAKLFKNYTGIVDYSIFWPCFGRRKVNKNFIHVR